MNREFIKSALGKYKSIGTSLITSFDSSNRLKYTPRILVTMNQEEPLLYASSILYAIRTVSKETLKFDELIAVCSMIGILPKKIFVCKDTSYFKPVNRGNSHEVLIRIDFAYEVLCNLGFGKDKIKKILGNTKRFSLEHYTKYVSRYEKDKALNELKNKEFKDEISLLPSKYEPNFDSPDKLPFHQLMKERVDSLISKATCAELHFKSVLESNNIEYIFQNVCIANGRTYIMDFYLPKHRICIEIDGEYHLSSEQLMSDKIRDNSMALCGILTIRFTNEEVMSNNAIHDLLPVLGIKYYSE